ncbi:phosphatase PAP2 family protein [Actinomadura syzygii]|nr:phosphatase PAP2 family protein [Actinomadura syzygii]
MRRPVAPSAEPGAGRWRRVAAPLALAAALAVWTLLVLVGGPVIHLDVTIRDAVVHATADGGWPTPTRAAREYAEVGDPLAAGTVLALVALVLAFLRRDVRPMLYAVAAVSLLVVTVLIPKLLYHRTGPNPADPGNSGTGFYPSGHTTTFLTLYGTALILAAWPLTRWKLSAIGAVIAVAAGSYGTALVWCNYHWTSDVIGGWLLGPLILWTVFAVKTTARVIDRLAEFTERAKPPKR